MSEMPIFPKSTLFSQGHGMEYIAKDYHMVLALAWALRLEGKMDQKKFKGNTWMVFDRVPTEWYDIQSDMKKPFWR